MQALRTPDECFRDLPGYDFQPQYLEVDDTEGGRLRMHYLDEGPREAAPVLLLHGEPSWSYLYRRMVRPLVRAGHRVVAPDLIGFGRSDKPSQRSDYTYARHVFWVQSALEQLQLQDITLFCQDWGGLIGLRLVAAHPQRFARVVAANTGLPTGDHDPGEGFRRWKEYSQTVPVFPAGKIVAGGCVRGLEPEVIAAYDAPFPEERYKAGARQFPALVPVTPDNPESQNNRDAWRVLQAWTKPFLTAFGDSDPITAGADRVMQKLIPGAQGQPHEILPQAGHFLQEDQGERLADIVHRFIVANR